MRCDSRCLWIPASLDPQMMMYRIWNFYFSSHSSLTRCRLLISRQGNQTFDSRISIRNQINKNTGVKFMKMWVSNMLAIVRTVEITFNAQNRSPVIKSKIRVLTAECPQPSWRTTLSTNITAHVSTILFSNRISTVRVVTD